MIPVMDNAILKKAQELAKLQSLKEALQAASQGAPFVSGYLNHGPTWVNHGPIWDALVVVMRKFYQERIDEIDAQMEAFLL